jgi:hypothetical protein
MDRMQSILTPLGLVLILLGGLRGGDMTSGASAFMAFLILGVATYPPADARRGAQAALVLATALGLLALGSLLDDAPAGLVKAPAMNDLAVLVGSAMVMVDAAGRLLGHRAGREAGAARDWRGEGDRAQPVPPLSRV